MGKVSDYELVRGELPQEFLLTLAQGGGAAFHDSGEIKIVVRETAAFGTQNSHDVRGRLADVFEPLLRLWHAEGGLHLGRGGGGVKVWREEAGGAPQVGLGHREEGGDQLGGQHPDPGVLPALRVGEEVHRAGVPHGFGTVEVFHLLAETLLLKIYSLFYAKVMVSIFFHALALHCRKTCLPATPALGT